VVALVVVVEAVTLGGRRTRGGAVVVMVAVVVALVVVVEAVTLGGRRARGGAVVVVVAVVREAAVPSSPRWRCWSPIAAMAWSSWSPSSGVVAVPASARVVAVAGVSSRGRGGRRQLASSRWLAAVAMQWWRWSCSRLGGGGAPSSRDEAGARNPGYLSPPPGVFAGVRRLA
jgi:hypothetical protein